MKGACNIYHPWTDHVEHHILDKAPKLDYLQGAVGGPIETVPYLGTIEIAGTVTKCVAFCNENGKLEGLPYNEAATDLWLAALERAGGQGILDDALCGSVIVLYGDAAFMRRL